MQLSTRGRYAVMALIDLSTLQSQGADAYRAVKLEEIAKRQEISLSYLEQLFAQLRRAGVVDSTRGPGGGYKLSRKEEDIYLIDIIGAVNEGTKATRCKGETGCLEKGRCNAHDLWSALGDHVELFMRQVSLKMACERDIQLPWDMNNHIGEKVHVRIS
jgi:Rrf2 family iron-sulfur cluster assembly transcriptional regulator